MVKEGLKAVPIRPRVTMVITIMPIEVSTLPNRLRMAGNRKKIMIDPRAPNEYKIPIWAEPIKFSI